MGFVFKPRRDASDAPAPVLDPQAEAADSELRGMDYDVQQQALSPGAMTSVPNIYRSGDGEVAGDPGAAFQQATAGAGAEVPYRAEMEAAFGQDFSGVRAHTGQSEALQRMGARGAARGEEIAFGGTPDKRLVAHELTHVVQQRLAGGGGVQASSTVSRPGDAAELEADRLADAVAGGGRADVQEKATGGIHRDIEATDEALGDSNVEQMNDVHVAKPNREGCYYAHNYAKKMQREGKTMPDDYWSGFANPTYWDKKGFMTWRLKAGVSAADAIEDFFKGPTVLECNSIMVAMEYRTVLRAVGKKNFDEQFGGGATPLAEDKRMLINTSITRTPLWAFCKWTEAATKGTKGKFGERPANKGEWYYVYNHPQYLLKHPAGAYQGENCFCMGENDDGEQIWRGFGVSNVTEQEMLEEMARAYNAPRTKRDQDRIDKASNKDLFDWSKGHFPETITWQEILKAPAYTYGGRQRKGGFLVSAGIKLDATKVKALKDK